MIGFRPGIGATLTVALLCGGALGRAARANVGEGK
jgi:hypothetical protein